MTDRTSSSFDPEKQQPGGTGRTTLIVGSMLLCAILFAALIWIVYTAVRSCDPDAAIPTVLAPPTNVPPETEPPETEPPVSPTASPSPSPSPFPTPTPGFGDVSAGDEILFGHYEPDNDPYYEPEPIPWIVLERQPGKILVLSKYALYSKAYQTYETERPSITWEQCELRRWLNQDFLSAAFDAGEQDLILTETVPADRNPAYPGVDPGNDTLDKVFLLSVAEVSRYLKSKSERLCFPTEFAIEYGADTEDADGRCWWWLRSPGHAQTAAAIISKYDGEITFNYIGMDNVGVRPAMWLICPDE